MKLALKKLSLAVPSAALALLVAGCPHKPDRPAPSQTVLGPTMGPQNINTAPSDASGLGLPSGLTPRGNEDWQNGQNRAALQAQTVYFDLDKFDIKPSEREKLKAAKEYLDKNPMHRLLLEGHCDWRGTAEYNLSLGDRRANAAKAYLTSIGVNATKLETVSKGSLEAKKDGGDTAWAKDRRVDLVIIGPARGPAPL